MSDKKNTAARSLVRAADKLRAKPSERQGRKVDTATELYENSKKKKR